MARYIDADKKIQEINYNIESLDLLLENRPYDEVAKEDKKKFEYLIREINNTPTADVVQVVRCKDCTRVNKYKDRYFCSYDNTQMEADDFCSCGVRRE